MYKLFIILLFLIISYCISYSQKEEVNKNLKLVAYGKIEEVKAAIPDLLAKYPNDPGVKLLLGTVLDDAFLALDVYKEILKNFPESEWADHAYWRIIQFYAVLGDTAKAQIELANFRSRYPGSIFITAASDVVRSAVNLTGNKLKTSQSLASLEQPKQNSIKTDNVPNNAANKIPKVPKAEPAKSNTPNKTESTDTAEKKPNLEKLTPVKKEVSAAKDNEVIADKAKLKDEPKKKPDTLASQGPAFYGLQVGIYKDKNTADSEKSKFLVKRLRTQVVEKEVNGVVMNAVVIGHYSSLESAEEGKKIVSIQCGCDPIIYKK